MTEDNDAVWMQHALIQAQRAAEIGEVPIGAVLVLDNNIIGEGHNQVISSSDPTAHAEIVALRDAANKVGNYRLPNTTMYITIEPCTMCLGAMVHARVGRIVFGATEPKAGVLVSNNALQEADFFNHSYTWQAGVCEKECAEVIQLFFQNRRKAKKQEKLKGAEKQGDISDAGE